MSSVVLDYALRLKDFASSSLLKFGQTSRAVFQNTEKMTETVIQKNRTVGKTYDTVREKVQDLNKTISNSPVVRKLREIKKELNGISSAKMPDLKSEGASKSGGFFKKLGNIGGLAAAAGTVALMGGMMAGIGIAKGSVGEALERQQVQTSFNVLAGDKDKGESLTKQLVGLQKDTILGSEVFKNAQTMMGFGFDSTEVLPNLKMLGDVSMGDAQKLGSLTLAFSQIKAAGKLMGQDLLQLINAGFNPLQEISQKTGKSIGELKGEVEKGNISFKDVQDAFISATSAGGRFENMLGKIAETPAGKLQQLQGEITELKIKFGEAFMPLVAKALDFARIVLPIIERFVQPLADGISTVVSYFGGLNQEAGGFSDYIKIASDFIRNHIVPFVLKVWNLLSSIVVKVGEFIGKSEILKDVLRVIQFQFGLILDFIGGAVNVLKWLFDNVVMPILNGIEKAYQWVKGMVGLGDAANSREPKSPTPIVPIAPNPLSLFPTPSGANKTTNLLTDIAKNTAGNKAGVQKNKQDVVQGGQKVVNISVGKFLDSINLQTMNLNEGTAEIEKIFMQMFSRVLVGSVNNSV